MLLGGICILPEAHCQLCWSHGPISLGVQGSAPFSSQLPPGLPLTRGRMWASMGLLIPPPTSKAAPFLTLRGM